MNNLSSISSIIAGIMAVMTSVVSWKVLKDHSTLGNPLLSVCVGALSYIGLLYLPAGLKEMVLLVYVALAIAILFLLLWMGFQKVRRSRFYGDLSQKIDKQIRRSREQERNLRKTGRQDGQRQDR
jgi:hypothetical protein